MKLLFMAAKCWILMWILFYVVLNARLTHSFPLFLEKWRWIFLLVITSKKGKLLVNLCWNWGQSLRWVFNSCHEHNVLLPTLFWLLNLKIWLLNCYTCHHHVGIESTEDCKGERIFWCPLFGFCSQQISGRSFFMQHFYCESMILQIAVLVVLVLSFFQ